MAKFSSSEPALRDAHWVLDASLLIVALLLLLVLYVAVRALLTKSDNLHRAPGHIKDASAVLKWISLVSPLLMLLGSCFELYDQLERAAMIGPVDGVLPLVLFLSFLVFVGIGISVSLFALAFIALIFLKRIRHEGRANSWMER